MERTYHKVAILALISETYRAFSDSESVLSAAMKVKDLISGQEIELLDSLLSVPKKDEALVADIQTVIDRICEPLPGFLHVNNALEDTIEYVASKIRDLLGYEPDYFRRMGKRVYGVFHPDDALVTTRFNEEGSQIEFDDYSNFYRVRHHITGDWYWLHGQYMNLTYRSHGEVWYYLGYGVDISSEIDLGNIPHLANHLLALGALERNPELTKREREVLTAIAEGLTDREIGERFFISHHTAATHRRNLLRKLEVSNTAGLVRAAVMYGLAAV